MSFLLGLNNEWTTNILPDHIRRLMLPRLNPVMSVEAKSPSWSTNQLVHSGTMVIGSMGNEAEKLDFSAQKVFTSGDIDIIRRVDVWRPTQSVRNSAVAWVHGYIYFGNERMVSVVVLIKEVSFGKRNHRQYSVEEGMAKSDNIKSLDDLTFSDLRVHYINKLFLIRQEGRKKIYGYRKVKLNELERSEKRLDTDGRDWFLEKRRTADAENLLNGNRSRILS